MSTGEPSPAAPVSEFMVTLAGMRRLVRCACIIGAAAASNAAAGTPGAGDGSAIAHDSGRGNCLACHAMPSDPRAITSANIGPPLVDMKNRFPDRQRLKDQIWDATRYNAETVMPPFGKNRILEEAEIDAVVEYLYTL